MTPTINEAAPLAPPPSPERIFQTLTAYQQTAALKAAIELDLFTAIAEGDDTPAKLAARTQAAERGVRILCDYLTVAQFLGKLPDGRYTLVPESALFLDRRSPTSAAWLSFSRASTSAAPSTGSRRACARAAPCWRPRAR